MSIEKMQAIRAYSDLQSTLLERINQNPDGAIPLSKTELGILFEGTYFLTLGEPLHVNLRGEWNEASIIGQFSGADTFLYSPEFTNRQFSVNGKLAWGGHLNYIAVGMLAAHYGPNMYQSVPALVSAHNIGQAAGYGGYGGGARHLRDIMPGTRWALMGADFYNRRRLVRR